MTVRWVTAFLDRPAVVRDDAVRFWSAVTGSSLSPWRGGQGEFATLQPADGDAFLRVQTVAPGGAGVHLDLHVDDVAGATAQALAAGAAGAEERDGYTVVASPSGLRWCLVPVPQPRDGVALRRPVPVRRPGPEGQDGAPVTLVDQVCLDLLPDTFAAECVFWQTVTGWDLHTGSRPEFAVLRRPAGMPLRLLLQRLDVPPAGGLPGAHLDLASSDVAAETALHEAWGARVVDRFPWWTVMEDPSGVPYCVTHRDPATGTLPA